MVLAWVASWENRSRVGGKSKGGGMGLGQSHNYGGGGGIKGDHRGVRKEGVVCGDNSGE